MIFIVFSSDFVTSFHFEEKENLNILFAYARKCLSISIFLVFRLLKIVNAESHFKLSSGLSDIFFIATGTENDIYRVASFRVEIWFQDKSLLPILKVKELTFYIIITTKATFPPLSCFKSLFVCCKVWRTWKSFQIRCLSCTFNQFVFYKYFA